MGTEKLPAQEGRTRLPDFPVDRPTLSAGRQDILIRAAEIESLCAWLLNENPSLLRDPYWSVIKDQLDKARTAVLGRSRPFASFAGWTIERAIGNLDAAEVNLLRISPQSYLVGQLPSLLNYVQRHLDPGDPRRKALERIAERFEANTFVQSIRPREPVLTESERAKIVGAVRGANSEALRAQMRVRSYRNVLLVTTLAMTLLAVGVAVLGWMRPSALPLCFAPEHLGQIRVVCA
jgi:hypothetical protein